ncbi:mannosyltransferase putative-domain-containing protein [Powellomyces hirtus]|nr:mannosyltransferase putative-domain-containing protein [Powellomyces hirtus]
MSAIESDMYPWLRGGRFGSAVGLVAQYTGSGIVMTTGNFHAKFALLAIGSIRALNCTLPIELFYAGDKDLSGANQALFTRLPAVTLIDISPLLHLSAAEHGWSLKPFAILASSFRHAIFIDADVLFLRSPAEMLTYQLYTTSGTLLFRDRTLYPGKQRYKNFFSEVMEGWTPSAYYADGRVGRDLSLHEGESGVVVMDKVRNFHALLMACKMNSGPWKEDMYIVMHGDKESYWISHELLSHPYRWVPGGGGSIGFLETPPSAAATASSFPAHSIRICGPLFHPSPSNAPLWINGGIVMNKLYDEGKQQMRFTHWAVDRTMRDVRWEWEKVDKPFCLYREDSAQGTDWGRIEAREMGVLDRALEEWETLKEL